MANHRISRPYRITCALTLALVLAGCQMKQPTRVYRFKNSQPATRPSAEAFLRGAPQPGAEAVAPAPAAERRVRVERPSEFEAFEERALSAPRAPRSAMPGAVGTAEDAPLESSNIVIDFLNVGQGDCTLITFPNGKRLLVDCGSTLGGNPSKIRSSILAKLDPNNPAIDDLVITHADQDHYNLLAEVLEGIVIGRVHASGRRNEHTVEDTGGWLESNFPGSRYKVITALENTALPAAALGDYGQAKVWVLASNVDKEGDNAPNSRSVVLKVSFGQFDCLLTGDATFETEEAVINRYIDQSAELEVEVLKLGHHGSRSTSTSKEWAKITSPEAAVASCGKRNSYGHLAKDVAERVFEFTTNETSASHKLTIRNGKNDKPGTTLTTDEAVYSTENSGNIRVISDGGAEFLLLEHAD